MEKRTKPIPEGKIKLIKELAKEMTQAKTVLLASCFGLPGSQFHEIKKKLRDKAQMRVVKKKAFERAVDMTKKESMMALKEHVNSNFVIFLSDLDAFELASLLADSQSKRRAKTGEASPEDIHVEPGPTDLVPGPAISELSGVGLKVAVKDGKLEIQKGAVIVKKGETIKENVAGVMGKLGIFPIQVGFTPLAAYDSVNNTIYADIKIDKAGVLDSLRDMIRKALGFAVKISYPTKETISYIISKAAMEEKAIQNILNKTQTTTKEDA